MSSCMNQVTSDINIVGTNILRSIQPVNHCDDLQFTDLLNDNTAALFQTISSCQVAQLTILTQSNSYTALVQEARYTTW